MLSVKQTASASQGTRTSIPALAKRCVTFASLLMGYWDWKSSLDISFTPQTSLYDISTEKKLTLYYLLEVYQLTTAQFGNWQLQRAVSEAGEIDLRGDGIWAMTFRRPGNGTKRPDWLQAGASQGGREGLGVEGRKRPSDWLSLAAAWGGAREKTLW